MSSDRIAQVAEFLQVIANLVASAAYDTIRARQVLDLEQLRDSLIHMIVHDLRTPLTSIIGGLQTIVHTEYAPDMTREFLPVALDGANALLELVNTLLDINKMESGEMKLDLQPLRFAQIAEDALNQVRVLARERDQELSTSISADLPAVAADAEKLRRVVVNLLGNAIKFTQHGGYITLSAQPHEGGLRFSVSDDGPGIPPEYRDRVFEKFGQVESRAEGVKNSTGLGLTFCKMVVEAHGGRIWVESEVGKGTTFSAFIPGKPHGPLGAGVPPAA
jgi:signal transduction histidine kinase